MPARRRIRLVHANAAQGKERATLLRKAGYQVAFEPVTPAVLKKLRDRPPQALVVDLTRTPSHGRDVAVAVRHWKATRHVPIVFAGGDSEKIEGIRKLVPDAEYAPWSRIRGALKRAIAHPPRQPVKTASVLAGYSGTPLPKKLGIKPGFTVGLIGGPSDFAKTLGQLPEGVTLRRPARGKCDLLIWFPASRKELERKVEKMGAATGPGGIWIAWPKQASGVQTDLTQTEVRRAGLDHGLVDYKICAIDATWSGLKFARRKP